MRVDLRTVWLVAAKELLESLRDKRTLFVALILPVLVYPIVTLGLGPVISLQKRKLAEQAQKVVFTGADAAAAQKLILAPRGGTEGGDPKAPALEVVPTATPAADLEAGRVQLWVDAPEGFSSALRDDRTAALHVRYDASDDRSLEAWSKWKEAVEGAAREQMASRLARQGLPEAWRNPIHVDGENVAPPEKTSAYVFGRILALLLVLMTLTSSFYPAVDAVAGEKERGTMETLLVAPCGRTELVLGKFGAVLAVTLAAAILNLASLAMTTGPLLAAIGTGKIPALQITWSVLGGILALLVPMAALFSAISLSLSTLARSVKEAQHYLSPLVMLVMPLAMVVVLPNLPLTQTLAAVPVTNAVLFFRDLMLGRTEWATTVTVMVSTFGFAALAIWASVLLFLREETLFRGPEGSGAAIRRPAPRPVPTAASAVFLFAGALAALWYTQGLLPTDFSLRIFLQQLTIIVAPCFLLAWWQRLDGARTFRLGRRDARTWAAVAMAVPLGVALPVVGLAVQRAVVGDLPPVAGMKEAEAAMKAAFDSSSGLQLVALLAILPAMCEESFFRGYVLSGLAGETPTRRSRVVAIVASAACFALFHVYAEKWANTFLVGAILAWIALRTGSLLPGLVAHALNNAAAVLAGKYATGTELEKILDGKHASQGTWVAVACGTTVVCLAAIHLLTRRGGESPSAAAARGT